MYFFIFRVSDPLIIWSSRKSYSRDVTQNNYKKIKSSKTHYNGIKYILYTCNNMKPAQPWMLAHLKIIWQFHADPVHQKVSRFFGPRFIGDDFFRAESSLIQSSCRSFIRVIVSYEISKVNFRVETKILVSMSEEI